MHLAITPLAIAAYNGHGRCVEILTLWMKAHDELVDVQKKCRRGSMSFPEQDQDAANTITLWASDWMTGILCARSQGHLDILHTLLANVDVNSPIAGLRGMSLLSVVAKMQRLQNVQGLLTTETINLKRESGGTHARHNAGAEMEVAGRDQHCDVAARLWDSRGSLQSQADILLFDSIACGDVVLLENHLLSLPGSMEDVRLAIFHRMLFRAAMECLVSCSYPCRRAVRDCEFEDADPFVLIAARRNNWGVKEKDCGLFSCVARLVRGKTGPTSGLDPFNGLSLTSVHFLMVVCSFRPLREVLHRFPELARERDARGRTALMAATASGSLDAVSIVLEALAAVDKDTSYFVNEVSADGLSAISYAVYDQAHQNDYIVHKLLNERGADPLLLFRKARNLPSWDPENQGDRQTCLEWRPFTQIAAQVMRSIENGWGWNKISQEYRVLDMALTALRAHADSTEVSRLIMECFVDDLKIHLDDFEGSEVQMLAWFCRMHDSNCLHILLRCCPALEPQLHVPDADGRMMLSHAALSVLRTGDRKTIEFLLKTIKVDPTRSDKIGCTALSRLAKELGLLNGANGWSLTGETLDSALETAALLIQSGADALAEDEDGWSPLEYAIKGHFSFEGSVFHRLLDDENTPLERSEGRGEKLLDLARRRGNDEAVRLLLRRSGRAGFWASRSKLKPPRRPSCDF